MDATEVLIELIQNDERLYNLAAGRPWDDELVYEFFEDLLTGLYVKWMFETVMSNVDMRELVESMNQIYFDSETDEYDEEGF
jgi:hypothetical protein